MRMYVCSEFLTSEAVMYVIWQLCCEGLGASTVTNPVPVWSLICCSQVLRRNCELSGGVV